MLCFLLCFAAAKTFSLPPKQGTQEIYDELEKGKVTSVQNTEGDYLLLFHQVAQATLSVTDSEGPKLAKTTGIGAIMTHGEILNVTVEPVAEYTDISGAIFWIPPECYGNMHIANSYKFDFSSDGDVMCLFWTPILFALEENTPRIVIDMDALDERSNITLLLEKREGMQIAHHSYKYTEERPVIAVLTAYNAHKRIYSEVDDIKAPTVPIRKLVTSQERIQYIEASSGSISSTSRPGTETGTPSSGTEGGSKGGMYIAMILGISVIMGVVFGGLFYKKCLGQKGIAETVTDYYYDVDEPMGDFPLISDGNKAAAYSSMELDDDIGTLTPIN